jgi:tripartite-type tricarboxylate transporter receptor subunit TctC
MVAKINITLRMIDVRNQDVEDEVQSFQRALLTAAVTATVLSSNTQTMAQGYPNRPITIVVPFPAGAVSDGVARILAERMQVVLGQPTLVENVPGASGSLAVGRVARSAPDGHMLLLGTLGSNVINGAVMQLQYDLVKDFEPISLLTTQPLVIVARKTMPADNLVELIAWLKANSEKATQGTSGPASTPHVAGLQLQRQTGTSYRFVPYRGAPLAMQDLLSGHIDMLIDPAPLALPQVRGGNIKAYAVTAKSRLTAAPEIPTADEAGLPGFHISNWQGLWAPRGTPRPIIEKLNATVVDTFAGPALRTRLSDLGQEVFPAEQMKPELLAIHQKLEIERWWPLIKAANTKPE